MILFGRSSFVTVALVSVVAILALSTGKIQRWHCVEAFAATSAARKGSHPFGILQLSSSAGGDDGTQSRIDALVKEHPVLLFMKGSKLFPQCGFSNTAVQILQSYNIDFHTVDVLSDDSIRQGIKVYSQWPTIPQVRYD
jgi:monothiol glutaredoxin